MLRMHLVFFFWKYQIRHFCISHNVHKSFICDNVVVTLFITLPQRPKSSNQVSMVGRLVGPTQGQFSTVDVSANVILQPDADYVTNE